MIAINFSKLWKSKREKRKKKNDAVQEPNQVGQFSSSSFSLPSFTSSFLSFRFHWTTCQLKVMSAPPNDPDPAADDLCDHCFGSQCGKELFTTRCCQTVYCPMDLERFLESQKSDTKTKSLDCETCSLVVKFDTLNQFVKGVHSEEIKGRPRALLDRRGRKTSCLAGH